MHVESILQKLLNSTIHKTRIKSLIPVVTAIIMSKQLKLTQLGRSLEIKGKERAGIRRVDRLLSNSFYQKENHVIYKCIIQNVVGNKNRPIILVDWSGIPNTKRTTNNGEHCVLRATLATEGRGVTLYDEIHSKKKEGNAKVHSAFLEKLKDLLSPNCCPIIVTDAGFKNPWFKTVKLLGWDYIGRVRGKTYYDDGDGFKQVTTLFKYASKTAKALGQKFLAASNPLSTNFYIYKHKLQGRKRITKSGYVARDKHSKKISRGYREPWLLVSSLSGRLAAKKVVKIYKTRMTIEENFRDVKSEQYGLSMNENKTIKPERLIIWLMLSALAALIAWIVGYTAEKMKLHYDFQANTYRHKRVLSFFYLGCQVIRKKIDIPINYEQIQSEAWGMEM